LRLLTSRGPRPSSQRDRGEVLAVVHDDPASGDPKIRLPFLDPVTSFVGVDDLVLHLFIDADRIRRLASALHMTSVRCSLCHAAKSRSVTNLVSISRFST